MFNKVPSDERLGDTIEKNQKACLPPSGKKDRRSSKRHGSLAPSGGNKAGLPRSYSQTKKVISFNLRTPNNYGAQGFPFGSLPMDAERSDQPVGSLTQMTNILKNNLGAALE